MAEPIMGDVKNVAYGSLANMLANLGNFVFYSVLVVKFSVTALSYYALAFNLYYLVGQFASLGIGNLLIRTYYSTSEKASFFANAVFVQIAASVVFYGAGILLVFLSNYGDQVRLLFIFVGLMILADNISYVAANVLISLGKQRYTAYSTIIEVALKVVVGIAVFSGSIASLGSVVKFLLVFRYVSCIVQVLLLVRTERRDILRWPDIVTVRADMIRSQLTAGRLFFLITLLISTYTRLPVLLLPRLSSIEQVAFFDVAWKILAVFMYLPGIVVSTFYPQILKRIDAWTSLSGVTSKFLRLFIPMMNLLIILACILVPLLVLRVYGLRYYQSIFNFNAMVVSLGILGVINTQANIMFSHKLERIDLRLNVLMLAIILLLTWLLVPSWGSYGVAASFFIARIVVLAIQSLTLRMLLPDLSIKQDLVDIYLVPVILFLVTMPVFYNIGKYLVSPLLVMYMLWLWLRRRDDFKMLFRRVKHELITARI